MAESPSQEGPDMPRYAMEELALGNTAESIQLIGWLVQEGRLSPGELQELIEALGPKAVLTSATGQANR